MSKQPSPPRKLHVLIIGGSVAGLTLANALSHANIESTVLEQRAHPFGDGVSGTALTLLPNGARILDGQLGLYPDITRVAEALHSHSTWLENGTLLQRVDLGSIQSKKTGYPLSVISRQDLLRTLYCGISDKKDVKFGVTAVRIISTTTGVVVHCADGAVFKGDVVVGADGVHSFTRMEMLRYMQTRSLGIDPCLEPANRKGNNPGLPLSKPPSGKPITSCAYSGLFGSSHPIQGLRKGEAHRTYSMGRSMIVTVGYDSRVHWYIAIEAATLRRISPSGQVADTATIACEFLGKHVTSHVKFEELYRKRISCVHVDLQERVDSTWSCGRFACIGDAVHKMTPNIAQGANCAMETAASLANHLYTLQKDPLTNLESPLNLNSWGGKTGSKVRLYKMKIILLASQTLIRAEAGPSWPYRLLGLYLGYFHGPSIMGCISDITRFTGRLDYLPLSGVHRNERQGLLEAGVYRHLKAKNLLSTMIMVLVAAYFLPLLFGSITDQ